MFDVEKEANEMKVQQINEILRLVPYDGYREESLDWYADSVVLDGAIGSRNTFDEKRVNQMFHFLHTRGLCYYIETLYNDAWIAIGDATLQPDNLPIVIGDSRFRGKGIGKLVLQEMIAIAKRLEYDKLEVEEIYHTNIASQKTYESQGFYKLNPTKDGFSYQLDIE